MIVQVDESISLEVCFDPADREQGWNDEIRFCIHESGPKDMRLFWLWHKGPHRSVWPKGSDCDTISFDSVESDCAASRGDLEASSLGRLCGCILWSHRFRLILQRFC
jgi:hypothetical protein